MVFCHSFLPEEHSVVDGGVDDAAVDVDLVGVGAFDDCGDGGEVSFHVDDLDGEQHSDGVGDGEGDVMEAAECGAGSPTHADDVGAAAGDGGDGVVDDVSGGDEGPLVVEMAVVADGGEGVEGDVGDDYDAVADGEAAVAEGVDDDGFVDGGFGGFDDVQLGVDCLFVFEVLSP